MTPHMCCPDVNRVPLLSALLFLLCSGCGAETGRDDFGADAQTGTERVSSELPFVRRFERIALPPLPQNFQPTASQTAAESAGVDADTTPQAAADRWQFPRIMAGGAGCSDFNGDGRTDLILVGLSPASVPELAAPVIQLLEQLESGEFADVTGSSGLNFNGIPCGIACGDFTNDGLPDLCLTGAGDCRLYENLGGFRFRDLGTRAGVSSGAGARRLRFWITIATAGWICLSPITWTTTRRTCVAMRPERRTSAVPPCFLEPQIGFTAIWVDGSPAMR